MHKDLGLASGIVVLRLLTYRFDPEVRVLTAAYERMCESPVMADSVEKLLFRSHSKNSKPAEASLLLGRGGPRDLQLRVTKSLITNAPTIHRVNCRLRCTLAEIRGE